MTIQSPYPHRGSSRRILLLTVAVLLLGAIWSVIWWFAAAKAEEKLTLALAREAAHGRSLTCGERRIGGYPFRLEFVCQDAKLEVTGSRPYTLTTPRFIAAVQLYWPSLVIAEASSPVRVDWQADSSMDPQTARFTFASAAASVGLGAGWKPDRASLDVKALTLETGRDDGMEQQIAKAHLELHGRALECPGCYQVAAFFKVEETPLLDAFLKRGQGLLLELQGDFSGGGDVLQDRGPFAQRAQAWQKNGGTFNLALLRVRRGGVALQASGLLNLDAEGFVEGHLAAAVSGAEELGKTLKESGLAPEKFVSVLKTGLSLLGKRTEIAGQPALEVPVKLSEGHLQIGAFPAGKAPRLFNPSE